MFALTLSRFLRHFHFTSYTLHLTPSVKVKVKLRKNERIFENTKSTLIDWRRLDQIGSLSSGNV